MKRALFLLSTLLCGVSVATAQDSTGANDQNVFVMGGPLTRDYFSDALTPWDNVYESNFFAGFGYQQFLYQYGVFHLGLEGGLGIRAGESASLELWGGAVARLEVFKMGGLNITPSLTAGLSVVTDTIGVETERAAAINRAVPVLYYLGPEIAVSHDALPDYEGFVRIQHRSGGFGTIAEIDGSNAVAVGLRYKF
ncbi:hypothetical protein SAMN05216456_2669 [Devosia crocina]|uniref:Outer membrane protein beta-barrel domain-containing protein n=1 Tax=Devosia crocina TaxID=429728 RepID=A0A1I7NQP4_9HYPH|nr:hypothetical protein [Devosia crocina]SFV36943.1 hypothetical protein SAMN05216456_2669 [Devosia crocina]